MGYQLDQLRGIINRTIPPDAKHSNCISRDLAIAVSVAWPTIFQQGFRKDFVLDLHVGIDSYSYSIHCDDQVCAVLMFSEDI